LYNAPEMNGVQHVLLLQDKDDPGSIIGDTTDTGVIRDEICECTQESVGRHRYGGV
jgi:hypothetical protein